MCVVRQCLLYMMVSYTMKCQQHGHLNKVYTVTPPADILMWMGKSHKAHPDDEQQPLTTANGDWESIFFGDEPLMGYPVPPWSSLNIDTYEQP